MFKTHLIAYTAKTAEATVQGIARVRTDHRLPSWQDCHSAIPNFFTGAHLGVEPQYTVRHEDKTGTIERTLPASGVERIGQLLMRAADRGEAWDIEVLDADGNDVSFDFACFRD
ncbi:hypothetical protein [Streptomyces sp. NPDC059994]|uniref:hypothetical protein n=1 Tax=Streptomyces sp. NPDC059994 TaxID=3347029 RepID=UPI0036C5643B